MAWESPSGSPENIHRPVLISGGGWKNELDRNISPEVVLTTASPRVFYCFSSTMMSVVVNTASDTDMQFS